MCSDQPKKLLKSSGIKGFDPYIEIANYLKERTNALVKLCLYIAHGNFFREGRVITTIHLS